MEVQKNHQLQQGTILDGRYEIGPVLGEGGFGITYSGTNIRTGEKVAIKEFYCREYMGRSEDGTGRTVLTAEHGRKRFKNERQRFLREARIVKDFRNDPSIVSVEDYFEENDTAYIVMEYIEGDTLTSYVSSHGKYEPEDLFDEIRPVMTALLKLHNAGIIHRDISPDNIIRKKGGRLVLIDFGSARDLSSNTQTTVPTYKNGYAPPEQYSAGRGSSAAIDIYGLCATLYYCLTATVPAASINRIIYEELEPVSGKAYVPDSISDMIMKGMALIANERYKSISEMLPVIEEVYPYHTPAEKARLKRRKRINLFLKAAVLTLTVLVMACAIIGATRYIMKKTGSVNIHFMWENKTQTKQMEPLMNSRAAAFAGKTDYEITVRDKEIILKIPAKLFNDQLPEEIARAYFAPKYSAVTLYSTDQAGGIKYTDEKNREIPERYESFYSDEIETLNISNSEIPIGKASTAKVRHLEIVLDEKAADRIGDMLSERGTLLMAEVGADSYTFYDYVFSAGDRRTMYLVDSSSLYEEQYFKMLYNSTDEKETKKIQLNGKKGGDIYAAIAAGFSDSQVDYVYPARCYCESRVEWMSVLPGFGAGENQCSPSEIEGDYTLLELSTTTVSLDTDDAEDTVNAIRSRLDALDIPYALGRDSYDERKIAIKTGSGQMYMSELALLCSCDNMIISNGFTEIPVSPDSIGNPTSGDPGIRVIIKNKTKSEELIRQNELDGMGHVYLKYGKTPVARMDTGTFKEQLNKAEVDFTDFCTETINDDPARKKRHIEFILAVAHSTPVYLSGLAKVELYSSTGELQEEGGLYSLHNTSFTDLARYCEEFNKKDNNKMYTLSEQIRDSSLGLILSSDDLKTENFEKQVTARIKEFIDDNELFTNDYQIDSIKFKFTNKGTRSAGDGFIEASITLETEKTGSQSGMEYRVSDIETSVSNERQLHDIERMQAVKEKLYDELAGMGLEPAQK